MAKTKAKTTATKAEVEAEEEVEAEVTLFCWYGGRPPKTKIMLNKSIAKKLINSNFAKEIK